METLDFVPYVTPTRFSNAWGVVLSIQLLRAAPETPPALARAALEKLREAALHSQSVAVDRLRASPENLKPIDARLDGGMAGLRDVLVAKSRLTGTDVGERAARLVRQVFPNGVSFVLLGYNEEWVAAKSHLARIDEDGLAAEIDALAGPEFLPFIRAAHAELGDALGVGTTPLAVSETTAVQDANLQLAKAIANYGRAMVAFVDEDDAESVAAFKQAMYPLDAYRRAFFARGGAPGTPEEPVVDPEVSPTDPIPPVPGEPAPA